MNDIRNKIIYPELSYKIQGAFYEVYNKLGNAHKEIIYHKALIEEFKKLGLQIESQKQINISYLNKKVGVYVPDLVIDDLILIEIKSKPKLMQIDIRQFWHYLKNTEYKLGYLVNFGSLKKVELIRRIYDTARIRVY